MAAEAGLGESSSRAPATDLLKLFGVARCGDTVLTKGASGGEVELGLSLGGCFGAEPEKNHLVRASSISSLSMYDDEGIVQPIVRTCSLPMESEEEPKKRDGLPSLKRLEVKRRRLEKRESRTGAKDDRDHRAVDGLSRILSISQRSVGSQGSSGLTDFDCRLKHGSGSCKEVNIPPSSMPLLVSGSGSCKEVNIPPSSMPLALSQTNPLRSIEEDKQSKKKLEIEDKAKELERSKMEEMPCVSARGNGPNGRMIQGLLYKYGNGVDVRIVCVCHGSFLTPAEFVKHAGGGDVDHPLRHIVVSRPPFAI